MDTPFLVQPLVCRLQLSATTKTIELHLLDVEHRLHTLVWKHSQWESASYTQSTIHAQQQHLHALRYVSSLWVTSSTVCVGSTNAQVHVFARKGPHTFAQRVSFHLSSHLSHVPLVWQWKRNRTQGCRSLVVEFAHSEPVENIGVDECHRVELASSVVSALQDWMGGQLLETLSITYHTHEYRLHSRIPFFQYVLNHVVGQKPSCSPSLAHALEHIALKDETRLRTELHRYIEHYVGGYTVVQSLPVRTTRRIHQQLEHCQSLSAHRSSTTNQQTAHISNQQTTQHTNKRRNKPQLPCASRDLFYFKMNRLLKCTDGTQYVREMFSTSAVFRHQFHQCKGYCYYKLLHKMRHLTVNGKRSVGARWTDQIRDKCTVVADGQAYHMCIRCGESVCKQEDELRVEFGELGQSTTHREADGAVDAVDAETLSRPTQVTRVTQEQQRTLSNVLEYIDRAQLTTYQQFIFDLPVTDSVRKYTKTNTNTFYQLILDSSLPSGKWSKLLTMACDAIRLKLDELRQFSQQVHFHRKPWEEQIVQDWKRTVHLSVRDIQRGIAPRKDFRPLLLTKPPSNAHSNWKRLHDELMNRTKLWKNTFDWTSAQNTNSFYEHNDVYACVNVPVVDVSLYTSFPQLVHSERRTPHHQNSVQTRYPLTKWQPRTMKEAHNTTVYRDHSLPIVSFELHHTTPRIQPNTARVHSDTKRRQTIVAHTRGYANHDVVYPRTIQLLLQNGVLGEHALVEQLHCLLGISTKQKLRMSTNPSMLLNVEWVRYYLQLDSGQPNENVNQLLKQIKRSLSASFTADQQASCYSKFIT